MKKRGVTFDVNNRGQLASDENTRAGLLGVRGEDEGESGGGEEWKKPLEKKETKDSQDVRDGWGIITFLCQGSHQKNTGERRKVTKEKKKTKPREKKRQGES